MSFAYRIQTQENRSANILKDSFQVIPTINLFTGQQFLACWKWNSKTKFEVLPDDAFWKWKALFEEYIVIVWNEPLPVQS